MFCCRCGVEAPNDSRYCQECGQPVTTGTTSASAVASVPPRIGGPDILHRDVKHPIVTGVGILVAVFAVIAFFGSLEDRTPNTNGGVTSNQSSSVTSATGASSYRQSFVAKLQSVMDKGDARANPAMLVHPTVRPNSDEKALLNIDCPKVEPDGGRSDGICMGAYLGWKGNSAVAKEARMAGFDKVVIWSPHFYKILILRGEPCDNNSSNICDALVDGGFVEKLQ
jgi:hypothetical protein